ncbi:succinoglycan biosynthesis protein ExoO [Armatimonadetes bacterium DC]|nr:succinoglycan biosynthesis protein ExoO [Armatimonadetes bacterium DC]
MPKVSIITPTYNVEPYIAQCIESVLAQTLEDWELILVDDASTDGTVAVIERYLDDPRIRLFCNEQNMGAGYTRNRALENATGEWLAMVDSDDWIAPQRLERLVQFAEEFHADMVVDLLQEVAPNGKLLQVFWSTFGKNPSRPRYYTLYEAIRYHAGGQPVIRHAFVQQHGIRFVPQIRKSQDYAFYMEILIKGARFAVLPEPMYYYRVRPGSITSTYSRRKAIEQNRLSLEYLKSLPEAQRDPRILRLLEAVFHRKVMLSLYPEFADHLKARRWREAFAVSREAPGVWWHFLKSIPGAIYRRWFARDRLVCYYKSAE